MPDDSNTAATDTTSGTSNDISLSCTRLPNTELDVRPSPIAVLTPEFVLVDPETTRLALLVRLFTFDFTFDFCCVLWTTTLLL